MIFKVFNLFLLDDCCCNCLTLQPNTFLDFQLVVEPREPCQRWSTPAAATPTVPTTNWTASTTSTVVRASTVRPPKTRSLKNLLSETKNCWASESVKVRWKTSNIETVGTGSSRDRERTRTARRVASASPKFGAWALRISSSWPRSPVPTFLSKMSAQKGIRLTLHQSKQLKNTSALLYLTIW